MAHAAGRPGSKRAADASGARTLALLAAYFSQRRLALAAEPGQRRWGCARSVRYGSQPLDPASLSPSEEDLILSPPVALNQHPADILRDLEQEATVLQRLQARITDQLLRLQEEEATLRKQMSSS